MTRPPATPRPRLLPFVSPPLIVLALVLPASAASAQSITGTVVDMDEGSPVPDAVVTVVDTAGVARGSGKTDGDGRFELTGVPAGRVNIRVEAFGYTAVSDRVLEYDGGNLAVQVGVERPPVEGAEMAVHVQSGSSRWREAVQMLSGRVFDALTGDPIPGADVLAHDVRDELAGRGITDEDGRFWIRLKGAGLYQLSVARLGYDSTATVGVAASPDKDLYVEIRVQPRAFGVEPITVSAPRVLPYLESTGFYARQRRGHGSFIGPRELQRIPGAFPSHVLRRLPGVSVSRGQIRLRDIVTPFGPCRPRLILDWMDLTGESLDDIVPMSDIEAIEVYKGAATLPIQWRRNGSCGAIVVWTKH